MFIHVCNYSDEVTNEVMKSRSDEVTDEVTKCGSDSLRVNERLMSREASASITFAVVEWY